MTTPLRRFAVRATDSRADPFRVARWRLTAIYCGILAVIVAVLSATLYGFHSTDVDRIERRGRDSSVEGLRKVVPPSDGVSDREGRVERSADLEEYLGSLGRSILIADLITLVVGGAASAFLAGRTLRPIRATVESEKQFFANAAHDLRTPLAVMRSEAEVALRAGTLTSDNARRIVRSSLEEIDRMSAMVEQVLDLARGDRVDRAASHAPLDLAAAARGMVDKAQARAGERGVRLTLDAPSEARIRGDALAIPRAIGNLLENSLAYTPPGGAVEVSVQRAHGHVLLRVDDTGIGIPEEDLPRITEPFFRGDRARGAHAGGAGLGLTIVKSIMDAHGGTLRAARRQTGGTSVTLRFPAG
jgi:two-component system sensor histidine kinase CiaH